MGLAYRNILPIRGTKINRFSVIIPAAGLGFRMKSYGPKSLLKLTPDIDIITHQLKIIQQTFFNPEIILVTGFLSNRVMNKTPYNIIKIVNSEYEKNNVVKSISLGLRAATSKNVLIIYGDLVFNPRALRIPLNKSLILLDRGSMTSDEVGCSVDSNGYINVISYDLSPKWAQIVYLTGVELEMAKNFVHNGLFSNLFGFEILNKIINNGGKFLAYTPKGIMVRDIDTFTDLLNVRSVYENSYHI